MAHKIPPLQLHLGWCLGKPRIQPLRHTMPSRLENFILVRCWADWFLVKPGTCLCLKGLISMQEIKFVTCHFIRRGNLVLDPREAPSAGPCPAGQPG